MWKSSYHNLSVFDSVRVLGLQPISPAIFPSVPKWNRGECNMNSCNTLVVEIPREKRIKNPACTTLLR